jgi:hypothetical protein
MLENQELWLQRSRADAEARWTILTADHDRLGQARWRRRPASGWKRWLWRPTLEVVESEDESLLFTARRLWGWSPAWEVRDADEHPLGRILGASLYDMLGRRLAALTPESGGSANVLAADGMVLATLERSDEGPRLTFAALVEENPFFKMLLLAVALVASS